MNKKLHSSSGFLGYAVPINMSPGVFKQMISAMPCRRGKIEKVIRRLKKNYTSYYFVLE